MSKDRTDLEWVQECNYISSVTSKGGNVREMNNNRDTFVRYCNMQREDAVAHGRDDTAQYIQHCIDDLVDYLT